MRWLRRTVHRLGLRKGWDNAVGCVRHEMVENPDWYACLRSWSIPYRKWRSLACLLPFLWLLHLIVNPPVPLTIEAACCDDVSTRMDRWQWRKLMTRMDANCYSGDVSVAQKKDVQVLNKSSRMTTKGDSVWELCRRENETFSLAFMFCLSLAESNDDPLSILIILSQAAKHPKLSWTQSHRSL